MTWVYLECFNDGRQMETEKDKFLYQSSLILTALSRVASDKRCLSHGMCLYQVMMTLHFLNDVVNDAYDIQKSKIAP